MKGGAAFNSLLMAGLRVCIIHTDAHDGLRAVHFGELIASQAAVCQLHGMLAL